MNWVLICLVIASDPFGSYSFTTDFKTEEACVEVMHDIVDFQRWQYSRDGKYNAYTHIACYSKEDGEKVIR